MSDACKACGASSDLERDVASSAARACMACGNVRVFSYEVIRSDNPHVDPEVVEHEVEIDDAARAWVGQFPRATRTGGAFMPANARAKTVDALVEMEREAVRTSAKSVLERLRAAGFPSEPLVDHQKVAALWPLFNLFGALTSNHLETLLSHAAYAGSIVQKVAFDVLATRTGTFTEVIAAIDALTPSMIIAAVHARGAATAEEIASVDGAIRSRLERTDPHSSYKTELERALGALHAQ